MAKSKDLQYPASVKITEGGRTVEIVTQVYYVGVYCAFYIDGRCVHQSGDFKHARFFRSYLQDIKNAKARGATVVEGPLRSLQEELAKVAI